LKFPTVKHPGLWIAGTVVVLAAIALEFYGRACGFLITPDSLQYLSAAKSFSESGRFLSPNGSYYSYWGPLFPIILSFFNEPQQALISINIVCKIILILALLGLTRSFISDPILKIAFIVVSMTGVHLTLISVFVWSELIFIVFILLNTHFALTLKKYPSSYFWFLISGFLACLQRDAGFFWVGGIGLWLLFDRSAILKGRIVQSVLCFFACTSGLIGWRIYVTFVIQQNSNFYDYSFFFHAFENLPQVLLTFGKMLLPLNGIPGVTTGILFFLLLFYRCLLLIKPSRNIQLLGFIISVYSLGFIVLPWRLDINEMDRYFSVITPLVYLFVLSVIHEKVQFAKHGVRVLIYTALLTWLCYPVTRTLINVKAWHERSCSMANTI